MAEDKAVYLVNCISVRAPCGKVTIFKARELMIDNVDDVNSQLGSEARFKVSVVIPELQQVTHRSSQLGRNERGSKQNSSAGAL
jgi:hypothetical protein